MSRFLLLFPGGAGKTSGMDNCWTELSFSVPATKVDLVSDTLYAIDSVGINVEERALDTFTVPDPDENIPSHYRIKAYFAQTDATEPLIAEVIAALRPEVPDLTPEQITIAQIRQEDWAEGWKQHFSSLRFGKRLVVTPTWEQWPDEGEDAVVTLDPGMAFGTGSHETTRLCLQALADRFDAGPAPRSVLDVGTGSGILAIAAAKLGADRIIGCEIDPDSSRVAAENVAMNGVAGPVEITDRLLENIGGRFDLVIANILAEENVRLARHLAERTADGGLLILSGILQEKEQFVIDGFADCGLPTPSILREGEWLCICYDRSQHG